jgi:hypothetical protein
MQVSVTAPLAVSMFVRVVVAVTMRVLVTLVLVRIVPLGSGLHER